MEPYFAPDFLVKVEGLTLEADVSRAVLDLTYDNSVETADMFRLQIDNSGQRFTDSPLFDVGKNVEIYMGYAGNLYPMMLGQITAVSPSFPAHGASTLVVTGYDKSQPLRHNCPDRFTFKMMNDSVIAAQIAIENGLIPVVDPVPTSMHDSLQQTVSDWELLRKLAERNFFQVYVRWDKLYFRFPRPQTELVTLEWGKNLVSFTPRISTAGLAGVQVIRGYDPDLAQAIVAAIPVVALDADLDTMIERLGSDFVSRLARLGRRVARGYRPKNFSDATAIAQSLLRQMLEGLYEGSGSCIGMPQLQAGEQIEIRGLGKRFSGRYRLHRITHTINSSGYQTSFEVSQRHNLNLLASLRAKLDDHLAQNRHGGAPGTMVGIVKRNNDPAHPGKVQVALPELSDGNISAWAAVASPMAGAKGSGMYFLPEQNDQVLVSFEGGDLNRPYIIGSLWSEKDRPAEARRNTEQKVIRTKSGMQILFDEKEGNECLAITHPKGSTITIEADGTVKISAEKDIDLQAKGNINIDAPNVNVKVSGTMDVGETQ